MCHFLPFDIVFIINALLFPVRGVVSCCCSRNSIVFAVKHRFQMCHFLLVCIILLSYSLFVFNHVICSSFQCTCIYPISNFLFRKCFKNRKFLCKAKKDSLSSASFFISWLLWGYIFPQQFL